MGITIKIEMKKIPEKCGECKFYSETEYRVHSERGNEAYCSLGYMSGKDMRDISYKDKLYPGCKLVDNIIK